MLIQQAACSTKSLLDFFDVLQRDGIGSAPAVYVSRNFDQLAHEWQQLFTYVDIGHLGRDRMVYLLIFRQNYQRGAAADACLNASVGDRFCDLMKTVYTAAVSQVSDDAGSGSLFLRWPLDECGSHEENDDGNSCHSVHGPSSAGMAIGDY